MIRRVGQRRARNVARQRSAVVPGLVSIDTDVRVRGSYLGGDAAYFAAPDEPAPYHYVVRRGHTVPAPAAFDHRVGYFSRSDGVWTYHRPVGRLASLTFSFDPRTRTFTVNPLMAAVPFEVGGIHPFGRHVADVMALELFAGGFAIVRAVAYRHDGATSCLVMPPFNGKTTLLGEVMRAGADYVGEDLAIIDFVRDRVFGQAPLRHNFGRAVNRVIYDEVRSRASASGVGGVSLDRLVAVGHGVGRDPAPVDPLPLVFANSFFFLNSPFIRSFVAVEGLWTIVNQQYREFARYLAHKCEAASARDYDFSHVARAI